MSEHTARRAFDGILEGIARNHEAEKRALLLSLAAGARDAAAKSGGKIPLAAIRTLLGDAGVEFKSDAALKMALSRVVR